MCIVLFCQTQHLLQSLHCNELQWSQSLNSTSLKLIKINWGERMDHQRSRMLLFFCWYETPYWNTTKRFNNIPMTVFEKVDFMVWLFMPQVLYHGNANPAVLSCTLMPGGNVKFAWLTPSSWTAAGSHWTGGGTQVWWGTWTLNQKCSSSECLLPGAHRASPATWTGRWVGISTKEKPR